METELEVLLAQVAAAEKKHRRERADAVLKAKAEAAAHVRLDIIKVGKVPLPGTAHPPLPFLQVGTPPPPLPSLSYR